MPSKDPSFGRMVRRALVLHCPWCGSRRTFIRRWLGKYERCRTCGIRWRREEGFELGAVTVNTVITFIVLTDRHDDRLRADGTRHRRSDRWCCR